MEEKQQLTHTLQDIKQMMERSSRFISLSGFSGIAAGICGLTGARAAYNVIRSGAYENDIRAQGDTVTPVTFSLLINTSLFQIAAVTFIAAFILAFIFTWLRSKKTNVPIWGTTARRLLLNVLLPMIAGGIFLLKLIEYRAFELIAPGCLIFYGLALVNASKYTLKETRQLGYAEILLGIINLFFTKYGLLFWSAGFGVLHIIYGTLMWWKYEKSQ